MKQKQPAVKHILQSTQYLFLSIFVLLFAYPTRAQNLRPKDRMASKEIDSLQRTIIPSHLYHHIQASYNDRLNRDPQKQVPTTFKRPIISTSLIGSTPPQCQDTSARIRYSKDVSSSISNDPITRTRNGDILIPGYDRTLVSPYTLFPRVMKVTAKGDTVWSRKIDIGYERYGADAYHAFEMKDGNILLVGNLVVPMSVNARSDFLLVKLTSNGDFIWQRTFSNTYWDKDTTGGSLDIFDCAEDAYGSAYLCGDVDWFGAARASIIMKVNPNGDIVWSKNYFPGSSSYFTGIDIKGNSLTVFGNFATDYSSGFCGIGINPDTGDTLWMKGWQYMGDLIYWHRFDASAVTKLNNGNYALYGESNSNYYNYDSSQLATHYGIAEFSPHFDFIKGVLFRSEAANAGGQVISVFEDGTAAYERWYSASPFAQNIVIGSYQNGQIVKERSIPYRGIINAWTSNFLPLDDGGQVISYYDIDSATNSSSIELVRLHNSDTAGSCVGSDTALTLVEPVQFSEVPVHMDGINSNVLYERYYPFHALLGEELTTTSGCQQISYCDSLQIVPSLTTFCVGTPISLSIRKNKACGAMPAFYYDSTAVQSFYRVNDTTLTVTFRQPWQGYIRADMNGCKPLSDSVHLHVFQTPAQLNLGPDTVVCPGNTLTLNARSGYASYRWQDGSSDSIYIITKPGKYYITTTSACGDSFSDTVVVSSHPPIPFDAGPDLSLCQGDSAVVTEPAGFIHYQWLSSSDTLITTAPTLTIFPSRNMIYKVTAEKIPGCFASGSFRVFVKPVPHIDLGRDTSFCEGQSLVLSAGDGFDSYQWSTGALTPSVTVTMRGEYSVEVMKDGCATRDTVQVTNVYALPSFSLGSDTALCTGQQLQYSFSFPQASYQWNNGSLLNSGTITQPGLYWLSITQNGCRYADTVGVSYKPSPVFSLGNDTTVCEGTTMFLQASVPGAFYRWQDGSNSDNYLVSKEGLYTLTVNLDECAATDSIFIRTKEFPHFTLGKDTALCLGQQLLLDPLLNVPVRYTWQNGSTAPVYTVSTSGKYYLTTTSDCGSYSDSIVISFGTCKLVMPTAFTPGNYGVNPIFKVKYPFPARTFHMLIFNRWGQPVFETNNMTEGWNGMIKSYPASNDTYVWQISYTDRDGKEFNAKGTVTFDK